MISKVIRRLGYGLLLFLSSPGLAQAAASLVQCTQVQHTTTTGLTSLSTSFSGTCLNADGVTTQACTSPVANNYLVTMLNWVTIGNFDTYTGQTDNQTGNTYNIDVSENRTSDHIAYSYLVSGKVNGSSGTYTITQHMTANGTTLMSFQTCEVSGVAAVDQVKGAEVNPGTSLTLTAPGANLFANEIVFTTFLAASATNPTAGYTVTGSDAVTVSSIYGYKILSGIETSSATSTFASGNYLGVLGTYRQDCAGASKLVFTAQPKNAALGYPLNTVAVTIQDSSGVTCTNSTNAITLSKDAGATWGTLASASSLTKTPVNGVATWPATDLDVTTTSGSGSIDATASGLSTATSTSITIRATGCSGSSPNFTASTWVDLQTCHTSAGNSGDTIKVLAGIYSATTNTHITKSVTIVADTTNGGVNVTDNVCPGICSPLTASNALVWFTPSSLGVTSMKGFTFNTGTAVQVNPIGALYIDSQSKPVVIQNNTINDSGVYPGGNFTWIYYQGNNGVVAGNTFNATPNGGDCNTQVEFVQSEPAGSTSDWATTVPFGSNDTNGDQLLYVEGNTINRGGLTDLLSNGRVVYRYNNVTMTSVGIHGVTAVNGRFLDVYNNLFITDNSTQQSCSPAADENFNGFIRIGGGVTYIHHNTIPLAHTLSWQDKPPVNFSAENLRRDEGVWPCWNTRVAVGEGYPAAEQPGWGHAPGGATQSVCTGPSCFAAGIGGTQVQGLDPIYLWANTGTGSNGPEGGYDAPFITDYDPTTGQPNPGCQFDGWPAPYPAATDYIQENREYYLNGDAPAGKPGYVAGTCPNAATGLTGTCDASANGVAGYNISGNSQSFTQQPTTTITSNAFSPPFSVTVSPPAADSITASINPPCGSVGLTGTLTITTNAGTGLGTFTGVGVTGSGTGCATQVTNNTDLTIANIVSTSFDVVLTTLSFTGQPANTNSGSTMTTVTVTASNLSFSGLVTLAINGCGATATNTTATASSGVATFTMLGMGNVGANCNFTASAPGASNATSANFDVLDVTAPVPGNSGVLSASSLLTNSITVNWTAATDNFTPQNQLRYEICQASSNTISTIAGCEASLIQGLTANITSANASGLSPSTAYWFNVVVADLAGNKAAYTPVTAMTTPPGPGGGRVRRRGPRGVN